MPPPNQPSYGQPEPTPQQGQPYSQPPYPQQPPQQYQQSYPPQQYQQPQGPFQQNPYQQGYMQATPMCPRCGGYTKKVGYTWWGGIIGPKMMNLHKCANCKLSFNATTMQSAETAIIIYAVVTGVVGLVGGLLLWFFVFKR